MSFIIKPLQGVSFDQKYPLKLSFHFWETKVQIGMDAQLLKLIYKIPFKCIIFMHFPF